MSSWHYRAGYVTYPDGSRSYGVYEVYISDNGYQAGWTEEAVAAYGTTKKELVKDLKRMIADIEQHEPFDAQATTL